MLGRRLAGPRIDGHPAHLVDGESGDELRGWYGIRGEPFVPQRHDFVERVERDLLLGTGTACAGWSAHARQLRLGNAARTQGCEDRCGPSHAGDERNEVAG